MKYKTQRKKKLHSHNFIAMIFKIGAKTELKPSLKKEAGVCSLHNNRVLWWADVPIPLATKLTTDYLTIFLLSFIFMLRYRFTIQLYLRELNLIRNT